jgi:hypothetical protein
MISMDTGPIGMGVGRIVTIVRQTAATGAVILDLEADAIDHPNGTRWHRLVLSQDTASDLYLTLHNYYYPTEVDQ